MYVCATVHLCRSGDNLCFLGAELRLSGLTACALRAGPSRQPLFIISKPHLFICVNVVLYQNSSSVNTHFIYSYHPVLTKAQRNSLSFFPEIYRCILLAKDLVRLFLNSLIFKDQ